MLTARFKQCSVGCQQSRHSKAANVGAGAKFFERKGLRNRRQTQTILMRFLRKSLIFLNICNLNLIVRGLPFNLAQLIKVLATPVSYNISNPLRQGEVFTDSTSHFRLQI